MLDQGRSWLSLAILLGCSHIYGIQTIPYDSPAPPCGVHLRTQAAAIHRYVESKTNNLVNCKSVNGLVQNTGNLGDSWIDGGIPQIHVDLDKGMNETTITHELFHLKLIADGINIGGLEFAPGNSPRVSELGRDNVLSLVSLLSAYLQHRLFYKDMIAMGLDPYAEKDSALKQFNANGLPPGRVVLPERRSLLLMEILDQSPTTVNLAKDFYKKMAWEEQFAMAETLHDLINKRDPKTNDEMIKTVDDCLVLLFSPSK
jgi:hypothetical protein